MKMDFKTFFANRLCLLAGILALVEAVFQLSLIRLLSYNFPYVDMLSTISCVIGITIFVSGIGVLFSRRLGRFYNILIVGLIPLLFLSAAAANSAHLFILNSLPYSILGISLVVLPFVVIGAINGIVYHQIKQFKVLDIGFFIAALSILFFFGYLGGVWIIKLVGIWNTLIVLFFLPLTVFFSRRVNIIWLLLLMLIVPTINVGDKIFSALKKEEYFWSGWHKSQMVHLAGGWSPYARLDFYKKRDGFVAGVYNGLQQWTTHSDQEKDFDVRKALYPSVKGDVLLVGAGGGYGVGSLSSADNITAVELDPMVLDIMSNQLNEYNSDVFNRVKAVAGDGRTVLEKSENKYDYVIYEGTDVTVSRMRRSIISMENYLYTVEGMRTAFNRLKDDGALIVLHATKPVIAKRLVAALPEEAYRSVWSGSTKGAGIYFNYILTIASRSPSTIKFWNEQCRKSGIFIRDITSDSGDKSWRIEPITDNSPLLYFTSWQQVAGLLIVTAVVALLNIGFACWYRPLRTSFYFTFLGMAFVITQLYLVNIFRSTLGGYLETSSVVLGVFSLAYAIGALLYKRIPKKWINVIILYSFLLVFICTQFFQSDHFFGSSLLKIALSTLSVGFAAGIYFPAGLARVSYQMISKYYALDVLGTALGFLLFYVVFLLGGFYAAFVAAFGLYLLLTFLLPGFSRN